MTELLCRIGSSRRTQPNNNGLCRACQRVPFRAIFQFLGGDVSVRNSFVWFPLEQSQVISQETKRPEITDDAHRRPFVKWHENIANLQQSYKQCSLCSVIFYFLKDSHQLRTKCNLADKRRLWLETPSLGGNPLLIVYVGNDKPQVRISGNYRFTTTPSNLSYNLESLDER
jgi:hypothetical protein